MPKEDQELEAIVGRCHGKQSVTQRSAEQHCGKKLFLRHRESPCSNKKPCSGKRRRRNAGNKNSAKGPVMYGVAHLLEALVADLSLHPGLSHLSTHAIGHPGADHRSQPAHESVVVTNDWSTD